MTYPAKQPGRTCREQGVLIGPPAVTSECLVDYHLFITRAGVRVNELRADSPSIGFSCRPVPVGVNTIDITPMATPDRSAIKA